MQSFWYWKQWRKEYRIIWYALALVLFFSLTFLWYQYFTGTDAVFRWQKFYDQHTVETVSHVFEVGSFEFSVPIESYSTFEYFNGTDLIPNTFAMHAFVVVLVLSAILLLTVMTTFSRFWYFVGTGLFILFIVSLRLDILQLFGLPGQWVTIITLSLYVLLSFYFNTFYTAASFTLRLISFLSITIILGIIINFFSMVGHPFLHLAVTGYVPGLILSVLFMIMIAHEIVASFVYLTSQGSASSKSLRHFMIICTVYFVNLFLAFMHEAGIIHWNFLYVNVYLLLTVSIVLSLWGYRQREKLYQTITGFHPFGAFFIAGMAAICLSTIGMLLGSANDSALKVIRDFIIFTHLGFGLIFFTYILSNFILMLAENMNVYKVLYTPNRMPYFTYRFAGLIAMLAFVFYSNWHEYVYHSTSGFYNSLGDLYRVLDKRGFAEAYYRQGGAMGFANHHSNYLIGYMEGQKNDLEQARKHYDLANYKRPTEYSLVNEGNLYLFEDRYFNAIYFFKDALKKFPDSGPIQNNLGYSYTKIHLMDSALLALEAARKYPMTKASAEVNFIAFLNQEETTQHVDSLLEIFGTHSAGVIGNALALATQQHQSLKTKVDPLEKKELDLFSATLLNNYLVNKLKEVDTATTHAAYLIATDSLNEDFSESLLATLAQAYYHQNNVNKAFQILSELAYLSQTLQGKYNYIMGLWALEQGNAELAAQCFDYAVEYSYKEAKLYSVIALAESQQTDRALISADTLLQSKDAFEKEIGRQLKQALTIPLNEVVQRSDIEKYQYFRFRIASKDSTAFNRLLHAFSDNHFKAQALLEMAHLQFNTGHTTSAVGYFTRLEGISFSDKRLMEKIRHFELELLASRGQINLLANTINDGITFSRSQDLEKILYTALLNEVNGDTISATKNYQILAQYNPFYEEGIIASARYFKKHSPDPMRAYNIITDAMHVNKNSVRLMTAYVAEAARMGFDEFAATVSQELEELKQKQ